MIRWTRDGLAEATSSIVWKTIPRLVGGGYQLIWDKNPDRWYIRRVDENGAPMERTIVYPSRNSPGLKRAWDHLLQEAVQR